jgi:hypothetical protein
MNVTSTCYLVCPLASHVDRWLTFEASLASQVSVPRMRAFLNQHAAGNPKKFLLRLSIGFGELWTFWAVEILPRSPELGQMFGFHSHAAAQQDDLSVIPLANPSVVPLWIDPLLMRVNIDCWLDRMIGDPQAGWQRHWFPDPSQIWQSEILCRICQHYQCHETTWDGIAKTAQQTLRWALKMSVLSYVMSHAFLVPESDLLFKGMVCSRAANKFVKMMVLPMLRLATQRTLSGLHLLFRASESDTIIWDNSFAVVFLCLIVAGSAQRSLFQRSAVCAANKESPYSRADAATEAGTIYSELAAPIIGLFHDTFHTNSKKKAFNPFGNSSEKGQESLSPFAMDVRTATKWYCKCLSSFTKDWTQTNRTPDRIPFDDQNNIGTERLLSRFMWPFISSC